VTAWQSWQSPGIGIKYGDGLVFVSEVVNYTFGEYIKGSAEFICRTANNVDLNIKSYFTNVKWDIAS